MQNAVAKMEIYCVIWSGSLLGLVLQDIVYLNVLICAITSVNICVILVRHLSTLAFISLCT